MARAGARLEGCFKDKCATPKGQGAASLRRESKRAGSVLNAETARLGATAFCTHDCVLQSIGGLGGEYRAESHERALLLRLHPRSWGLAHTLPCT